MMIPTIIERMNIIIDCSNLNDNGYDKSSDINSNINRYYIKSII